jgi:hypothetical protein
VNANENAVQSRELGLIPTIETASKGIAVEPREFENLLERAMEVLAARAEWASPHSS